MEKMDENVQLLLNVQELSDQKMCDRFRFFNILLSISTQLFLKGYTVTAQGRQNTFQTEVFT